MRKLRLEIPGTPLPKKRARTVTKGRNGKPLPFAKTYDPQDDAKKDLAWFVQAYLRTHFPDFKPVNGPIRVHMVFLMPVPKSWPKYKKRVVSRGCEAVWHWVKPDGTNLFKFPEDALNGILWNDDGQVAWFSGQKMYHDNPRTIIEVEKLQEPEWKR